MSRPITFNKVLGTRTVAPSRPIARPVYGAGDDAETRARQVAELQRSLQQATDAATAATTAKYVTVHLANTEYTTVICHKLGRRARWSVVQWTPDTPNQAAIIASQTHDDEANTLILGTQFSGTAQIKVE